MFRIKTHYKFANTMIEINDPQIKQRHNSRPISAIILHILQSHYAFPFFFARFLHFRLHDLQNTLYKVTMLYIIKIHSLGLFHIPTYMA